MAPSATTQTGKVLFMASSLRTVDRPVSETYRDPERAARGKSSAEVYSRRARVRVTSTLTRRRNRNVQACRKDVCHRRDHAVCHTGNGADGQPESAHDSGTEG